MGSVPESDVKEMRAIAEKLRKDSETWIAKNHSDLKTPYMLKSLHSQGPDVWSSNSRCSESRVIALPRPPLSTPLQEVYLRSLRRPPRCCGGFCREGELGRDGQADYGSIGFPAQGRIARNLASPSQSVGFHLTRVRARPTAFTVVFRFSRFSGVLRPLPQPNASAHPRSRCSCLLTGRGKGHPEQS